MPFAEYLNFYVRYAMSNPDDIFFSRRALMQLTVLGLATGAVPGFQQNARAQNNFASAEIFTSLRDKPQLSIGILIFPTMDQIDFTGPFEVLVRVPGAKVHVIGTEQGPF